MSTKRPRAPAPKNLHIDKRADQVIAAGSGGEDEMLSTIQVAAWLGLSTQWLEIGRHRGYGPPFVKYGARRVMYRRGAVLAWLRQRTFASTAEYGRKPAEVA
jgi:hypothetical protein